MSSKPLRPGPLGARSVRNLLCGDEGAVTMVFAVCASMMVGALCTAIDSIHYEMTQARMQMALDVATLSAGADLAHYDTTKSADLAAWKADARNYYDANMPSGYMSINMPDSNFTPTVTGSPATGQTIQLTASGSIPLIAPIFFGNNTASGGSSNGGDSTTPKTATVSASNAALRQPKSTLELVMVLDNSSSMNDAASTSDSKTKKIDGLKAAANNLVTNLFSSTTNDSYVGLVPFTTMVNVSDVLPAPVANQTGMTVAAGTSWINSDFSHYNTQGTSMSAWRGCPVEPRDAYGNLQAKAYAPKSKPGFTPFYWNVPPTGFTVQNYQVVSNNWGGGSYVNCNKKTTKPVTYGVPLVENMDGGSSYCTSSGNKNDIYNYYEQADEGSSASTYSFDQNYNVTYNYPQYNYRTTSYTGWCEISHASFLSNKSSTITNSINAMSPYGNTVIPTGLLWGWRMLSSDWSQNVAGAANGFISTDPTLPRPESTQALQRVMIVLTDGENAFGTNTGQNPGPYFNGLSGVGDSSLQVPTVYRQDGKTTLANGDMTSVDDINAFQLGVCTAIKQSGVIIYAITFGTYGTDTTSVNAQATMQACASPGNYYHAPTSTTLNQIFQQIAGNLGVLRLTQ